MRMLERSVTTVFKTTIPCNIVTLTKKIMKKMNWSLLWFPDLLQVNICMLSKMVGINLTY